MSKYQKLAWLIGLLALLFVMVSVGGITRLSKSGLSITEWKPVTGILPPLSEEAWLREFDLYKNSPEFKHHNAHFDLQDYKGIFWWEYIHRVLGRVIFLFAVALSFSFWRKKEASGGYALLLPMLIVFQGLMGWLMVKTGLNHRPSVSHYMLTVHFFLAVFTMTVVYYPLSQMKKPLWDRLSRRGYFLVITLGVLLGLQIVYGCFTAGLKAGFYFGTFPFMGGQFFPPQGLLMEPAVHNFFENPITVQWIHRWLGVGVGLFLFFTGYHLIKHESPSFTRPVLHLVSLVIIQIILGISTLLFHVPISLAVFHQAMAALIWLGYCNIVFRINCKPSLTQ
ncbi:MAG: COX15/CtaA family protein [Bdellovibrionaceae bacterium]|nr:COX15/CtaA family protein [Pseudobdellovibrionaceae bacterium]